MSLALKAAAAAGGAALVVLAALTYGGDARAHAVAPACDLAHANKMINQYTKAPTFTPPGPSFDAKELRGKVIHSIPIFSNSEFVNLIDSTMAKAAKELGIKIVLYRNQGKVSEWQDAMNRSIAARADAIFLGYAPDPKVLQPQIVRAKQLGIPTISSHWYDVNDATATPANVKAPNLAADVPTPFTLFARLEVLWAIKESNCNAHIAFLYSVDADPHKQAWNAAKDELQRTCPNTCSITPVGLPYVEWPTKAQSNFQSVIAAKPNLNWLMPFTDLGVQYAVSAIRTSGKTGKLKIATFNATPAVLKQIRDGEIVEMDIGENLEWLGYAYLDQVMRVMAGVKPLKDSKLGIRIFNDGNIREAGNPPSYRDGYGKKTYVAGYRKLWGLG
jgi:ribose transport system substrate-binding protein